MKETTDVSLVAVRERERERELYFTKSKNSFKNRCFKKDSNRTWINQVFVAVFFREKKQVSE